MPLVKRLGELGRLAPTIRRDNAPACTPLLAWVRIVFGRSIERISFYTRLLMNKGSASYSFYKLVELGQGAQGAALVGLEGLGGGEFPALHCKEL